MQNIFSVELNEILKEKKRNVKDRIVRIYLPFEIKIPIEKKTKKQIKERSSERGIFFGYPLRQTNCLYNFYLQKRKKFIQRYIILSFILFLFFLFFVSYSKEAKYNKK